MCWLSPTQPVAVPTSSVWSWFHLRCLWPVSKPTFQQLMVWTVVLLLLPRRKGDSLYRVCVYSRAPSVFPHLFEMLNTIQVCCVSVMCPGVRSLRPLSSQLCPRHRCFDIGSSLFEVSIILYLRGVMMLSDGDLSRFSFSWDHYAFYILTSLPLSSYNTRLVVLECLGVTCYVVADEIFIK